MGSRHSKANKSNPTTPSKRRTSSRHTPRTPTSATTPRYLPRTPTTTPTRYTKLLKPEPSPEPPLATFTLNIEALAPLQSTYFIAPNEIVPIRPIDSSYLRTEMSNWCGQPVLVKSVDSSKTAAEQDVMRQKLTAEITSMTRMSHPNIVQFLGFSTTPANDLCCVTEYVEGRTLRHLLNTPKAFAKLCWSSSKLSLAIDIASALAAMHALKPTLIHRNVKASKVLLTNRHVAKLSGFGAARDQTFEYDMTSGVSDLQWSAPELLMDGEDYNEKIDVYAFGMLLTEIDTGDIPFATEMATMKQAELAMKLAAGAIRPKLSPSCPMRIQKIALSCLQHDKHLRPSIAIVLRHLQQVQLSTLAARGQK
ncbi:TKL protein kinase [Saprolegnia diclina VS20]|uniref:TKL protein kinase n=1 Tax=Saprolegnia diclina (strain VS20) TaxID=1156394 RepID=T0QI04_SAPDV|nr:TKL protein kinase [Saprolegnia diclina VS20]EQC37609.1 TKL protein kinase [Saprolegnia diclina VS20]|eukprot:XP_008609129.1 TKL protein kinase [Saprolegnia diclina VS20]